MEQIRKESLATELLAIFYIQKKIIQITFLVVFLGFIIYAVVTPNVYRAEGTFVVKAKSIARTVNSVEKADLRIPEVTEEDLYTEAEILTSNESVTKTATEIINKKLINFKNNNKKLTIDGFANSVRAALTVEVLPKSKVIRPAFLWRDPKEATIILNALMNSYLHQRQNIENPQEITTFLQNQVDSYLMNWKNKKSDLLKLIEKYNAPNPDSELTNNLLLKKEYTTEINQLEQKRDSLKSEIETLEKMLTDGQNHIYTFMGNTSLSSLVDALQRAQKEKEEAEKIFLPTRPEVKEANELFENSYKTIKGEAVIHIKRQKADLKTTGETLISITNKLRNLEVRNMELKKLSMKIEEIQLQSTLIASSFEVFYNRRDESSLKGTLQANIAIISHAKAGLDPVQPIRVKIIVLGLFLAIALSLTSAFILFTIDQTIKTPRDVENYLHSPVIFSIKDIR